MGVKMKPHASFEFIDAEPLRCSSSFVYGSNLMIASCFNIRPVSQRHFINFFNAIIFYSDDLSDAPRIIYRQTNEIFFHYFPDRIKSDRRTYQSTIWLAGRALRRIFNANVKPHGRIERRFLMEKYMRELVRKNLGLCIRRKISGVTAPRADDRNNTGNH